MLHALDGFDRIWCGRCNWRTTYTCGNTVLRFGARQKEVPYRFHPLHRYVAQHQLDRLPPLAVLQDGLRPDQGDRNRVRARVSDPGR